MLTFYCVLSSCSIVHLQSFVNVAFETARQIDPSAKLYINDYNLDAPNPKVDAVVALVKKLNSGATKLVDGVGTQMHLNVSYLY